MEVIATATSSKRCTLAMGEKEEEEEEVVSDLHSVADTRLGVLPATVPVTPFSFSGVRFAPLVLLSLKLTTQDRFKERTASVPSRVNRRVRRPSLELSFIVCSLSSNSGIRFPLYDASHSITDGVLLQIGFDSRTVNSALAVFEVVSSRQMYLPA